MIKLHGQTEITKFNTNINVQQCLYSRVLKLSEARKCYEQNYLGRKILEKHENRNFPSGFYLWSGKFIASKRMDFSQFWLQLSLVSQNLIF